MVNFLFFAFFGLFFIVIQSNPVLNSYFFPVKPDLTIPLAVYISLSQRPVAGGFLVLWLGFLMDLFSGGIPGLFLFLRGVLFFLVRIFKKLFFLESKVFWFLLVVFFFFVDFFFVSLFLRVAEKTGAALGAGLKTTLAQASFTLILCFLVFPPFFKMEKQIHRLSRGRGNGF